MHLILRQAQDRLPETARRACTSQAVLYALAFFPGRSSRAGWLDSFAVPALVVELVETQHRDPVKIARDEPAIPLRGTSPFGLEIDKTN